MDTIKILSKLKKEENLNRDHKVLLLLLSEQYHNPSNKLTLTPTELENVGLYGIRAIHKTLKDLIIFGYVDNMKGNYQITPKFQYLLSSIDYKQYREQEDITDITGYSESSIEKFLEDKLITNTSKSNLMNDLKITSNQFKTIEHHFKDIWGDIDGKEHFKQYKDYVVEN